MRCANRVQLEEQWWVIASVLESDDGGLHLNLTDHGTRPESIVWQLRRLNTQHSVSHTHQSTLKTARFKPCGVTPNYCALSCGRDCAKVLEQSICQHDAATHGWVPLHSATYTQLTHEMTREGGAQYTGSTVSILCKRPKWHHLHPWTCHPVHSATETD